MKKRVTCAYTYIKLSAIIITVNDLVACAVAVVSKTYIYFVKGQQNVDMWHSNIFKTLYNPLAVSMFNKNSLIN